MKFFSQTQTPTPPDTESLPLTSPSPSPYPSCVTKGSSCRAKSFFSKNKDNCAFGLILLLLVSLGGLSAVALFSPWYVADVDFATCTGTSSRHSLSHSWFHTFPGGGYKGAAMCQNQYSWDSERVPMVLFPLDFPLDYLTEGYFGPALFPKGAVDTVYVMTFILSVVAAAAIFLASGLFLFRLVRPTYRPEGFKFMSMTFLFLAFLFSLLAVIFFAVGLPIATHHQCQKHGLYCLQSNTKFFDSTTYPLEVPSGQMFHPLNILVKFHPGHGWYFSLSVTISLFLVFLVSICLNPASKQTIPVPNTKEYEALQTLVC